MTHRHLVLALTAFLAVGCSSKTKAPWPVGLKLEGAATSTTISKTYRVKLTDAEPQESKGVLGTSGSSCAEAGTSLGARTTTTTGSLKIVSEVVGETPWDHPLLPGLKPNGEEREFSNVWVSVVQETVETEGNTLREEEFFDPNQTPSKWSETQTSQFGPTTDAAYYGVAADEYVIKIKDMDLWNTYNDTAFNAGPGPEGAYNWLADNGSAFPPGIDLMTRHDPKKGDVWASVNGNFLFFYRGTEDQTVGGKGRNADMVDVMITANIDDAASGVLEECIFEGNTIVDITANNATDINTDTAFLDPGCAGNFEHAKRGTEWWYDDVLVKSNTEVWSVQINDYGYEYYDQPGGSGTQCNRVTLSPSTTGPIRNNDPNSPSVNAELYLEYTVSRTVSDYKLNKWAEE